MCWGFGWEISKIESKGGVLNLLSSPSSISFSHVLWWLDRRNELQYDVSNTNKSDQRTEDLSPDVIGKENRSAEDVDYKAISIGTSPTQLSCITYRHHDRGRRTRKTHISKVEGEFGILRKVSWSRAQIGKGYGPRRMTAAQRG